MGERKRVSIKLSLLAGAGLAVVVLGAVWLLSEDPRDAEIRRLREVILRLEAERRVAEVVVVGQETGPDGKLRTRFRFAEWAPDRSGAPREFEIEGDVAYFDALVVKFDHEWTKLGDPLRGRTLYLFRRVFGEHQEPSDGFPLDPFDKRGVPAPYRLQEIPSDFERDIWGRFWEIALNPDLAKDMGVRVAQGEAVYHRLEKGKLYRLAIEDAGGLNIHVMDAPSLRDPAPPGNP